MYPLWWLVPLWVDVLGLGQAPPALVGVRHLEHVNRDLAGHVVDFTHNHGADRRIWSAALGQRRDLYVYLPPGYDPCRRYPLVICLHGAAQDEQFFLQGQVVPFDRAIADGRMPAVIMAVPDGSLSGRAKLIRPASFWCNSRAGRFEDFVMGDVWQFMHQNFPIAPAREAHALVGASMGGSAAFALAIKHRDCVGTAMGFLPLLNLRYVDCHGHYRRPFDPGCTALRERWHGAEALGRRKMFVLTFRDLYGPLFGRGDEAIAGLSAINPLELMERCDLHPGELNLFVAYGGCDEFNVAAQVESFLYAAHQRGVEVGVAYDPRGRHDLSTAMRLLPAATQWASEHMPALNAAPATAHP